MAAQLAAQLGAQVSGQDSSEAELVVARERVPNGDFRCGEMEELPYADASFDVVTGFNSLQFAEDPLHTLMEARRVTKPGGCVAMVIWGRMEGCEIAVTFKAALACLSPFALSEPDRLEALMEEVGLTVSARGDVSCPFAYSDDEIAWKTIGPAEPMVVAIRAAGEGTIKQAVLASLAPFKTPDGAYQQENLMHYAIATA